MFIPKNVEVFLRKLAGSDIKDKEKMKCDEKLMFALPADGGHFLIA